MKKQLKKNPYYKSIIDKEYDQNFKYYEDFEVGNYVYLFFYHHRLIYPLTHDLYGRVLDRGPILINKATNSYEKIHYNEKIVDHFEKIKLLISNMLIQNDSNFIKNITYDLLIDLVKERKYLNLHDLDLIAKLYSLDEDKIRYNSVNMDLKKPHTNYEHIALYLYDNFSVKCHTDFLDELHIKYSIIEVDNTPVLLIPDKNLHDYEKWR